MKVVDSLKRCIAGAPDPEKAANAVDSLNADPIARRRLQKLSAEARKTLVQVLGLSNFLLNFLCRHPEAVSLVGKRPSKSFRGKPGATTLAALYRYKYRELFKITCLDFAGGDDYESVLAALSDTAISVMQAAHTLVGGEDDHALTKHVVANLCCLGMGKLGAHELNYSSDVDLMFIYPNEAEIPFDFEDFHVASVRHIRKFSQVLEQTTEEGFLYRVDLKLRPWGIDGPLAMSIDDMERYYEESADHWERIAWIRGKPVAGDLALGEQLVQRLQPFIYRRALGFDDIDRLLDIKSQMARMRERADRWNVKLGPGGIRDVEFFAQILQLLHGGSEPSLRTRNTVDTLANLSELGLIEDADAQQLRVTYLFLRRLEHRVQIRDERQTHDLPTKRQERLVLARSLGNPEESDDVVLDKFEEELAFHQMVARSFFERVLPAQS